MRVGLVPLRQSVLASVGCADILRSCLILRRELPD